MFIDNDTSGNDTVGTGLLAKWKAKRMEKKARKVDEYREATRNTAWDKIQSLFATYWLWIAIAGGLYMAWKFLFKKRTGGFRRKKKSNSGRAFYLRMKRAKARKNRK